MNKMILVLSVLFVATVAGAQTLNVDDAVLNDELSADQAWFQTLPLEIDDEAQVEQIQWHGSSRNWTCWARNRRGITYRANGWSREQARRGAMSRCASRSSGCVVTGCR